MDLFISVDVETAGPIPGEFSMLALGAAVVGDETKTFYVEFEPLNDNFVPAALEVSGFDIAHLHESGKAPVVAMREFADWLSGICGDARPVFVGFNAGFDWSFVNWYFHRYLGNNPFGYTSIDIKSFYMGVSGCDWNGTRLSQIPETLKPGPDLTHNALSDAIFQGNLFMRLLAHNNTAKGNHGGKT